MGETGQLDGGLDHFFIGPFEFLFNEQGAGRKTAQDPPYPAISGDLDFLLLARQKARILALRPAFAM